MEVVATGETDLKARQETAGSVLSARKDLRKWERLLWWKAGLVPCFQDRLDAAFESLMSLLLLVGCAHGHVTRDLLWRRTEDQWLCEELIAPGDGKRLEQHEALRDREP